MIDHLRNLERINEDRVRAAYCSMVERSAVAGLRMSNNNGAVAAIRCYANDDYVFSFCSYQNYVSFYLRHPALNRWAGLHQTATKRFEEVNQNPAGETIIKIRNQEVANDLADWLYALL